MKIYGCLMLGLSCLFIGFQMNAQPSIFLKYDKVHMNKYIYQIRDFSKYQYLLSYHILLKDNKKVILNVSQTDSRQVPQQHFEKAQPTTTIELTNTFMRNVNNNRQKLYIIAPHEDGYVAYKISTAIYVETTDYFINYSGPFYSFFFDKNKTYTTADNLEKGMFTDYNEANYMLNTVGERSCRAAYQLVKLISAAQTNSSFSFISKADFNKLAQNAITKIATNPIYIDLVEGIGIVKETTAIGSYELLSINGKPLELYLSDLCQEDFINDPANQAKSGVISKENTTNNAVKFNTRRDLGYKSKPVFKKGKNDNNTSNYIEQDSTTQKLINTTGNTPKSPAANSIKFNSNRDLGYKSEPVFKKGKNDNNTSNYIEQDSTTQKLINTTGNTPKSPAAVTSSRKIHIVDNGENLYKISVKYNIPIERLKKLNDLKDEKIHVTQKLIIE